MNQYLSYSLDNSILVVSQFFEYLKKILESKQTEIISSKWGVKWVDLIDMALLISILFKDVRLSMSTTGK
jgi:hypothetical protein